MGPAGWLLADKSRGAALSAFSRPRTLRRQHDLDLKLEHDYQHIWFWLSINSSVVPVVYNLFLVRRLLARKCLPKVRYRY